jgi:hypothetical protein
MVKHVMKHYRLIVVVAALFALTACAGNLSQQVEQSNRHMIKLSETMHNAVAPAPTLNDVQFRSVNADLNAIAIANKAWTVAVASGGDPVQATIDFFNVFKTQIGKLASDAPAIALANLKADITTIQAKVAAAVGP